MITGVNAGVNNAYTLGSLTGSTRTGAVRTVDMGMINVVSAAPPQQQGVGGGKLPGTADEYLGILKGIQEDNMQQGKKPGVWQRIVNIATLHAINSRAGG